MRNRIDYKSENAKLREKIVVLQMDITHLNKRLLETDEENIKLQEENLDILKRLDSTPSDCKPGSYCKVCAFGDPYFGRGMLSDVVYLCKKGKSCTNFIPKSEVKNDG